MIERLGGEAALRGEADFGYTPVAAGS